MLFYEDLLYSYLGIFLLYVAYILIKKGLSVLFTHLLDLINLIHFEQNVIYNLS